MLEIIREKSNVCGFREEKSKEPTGKSRVTSFPFHDNEQKSLFFDSLLVLIGEPSELRAADWTDDRRRIARMSYTCNNYVI